jgi:hypothetical protein
MQNDRTILADHLSQTTYIDTGLALATQYVYAVSALDGSTESPPSPPITAAPDPPPRLWAARALPPFQIEVRFSEPLGPSGQEPFRYRVIPEIGVPSTAVLDRGGYWVVLSFGSPLPDTGVFSLEVEGLRDRQGTPIAADAMRVAFTISTVPTPTGLRSAEFLSPTCIVLRLSSPVELSYEDLHCFSIWPERAILRAMTQADAPSLIRLDLAPPSPLDLKDQPYELTVDGLFDLFGREISGTIAVEAVPDLHTVLPFPHPFAPGQGVLTFGNLTPEAEVRIYTLSGVPIRTLAGDDNNGEVYWDGRNEHGARVGSGIYYYWIEQGGKSHKGTLAVVR